MIFITGPLYSGKRTFAQTLPGKALADVQRGKSGPIPRQLQNKHYDGEDALVKGQHYLYPHDYPNHWIEQQYLPDALKGRVYYQYGENKNEQAARAYWQRIKHP